MTNERRSHPRLLCTDGFSDCEVIINDELYITISIDFNHTGIAIFTNSRLPDTDQCLLRFSFEIENASFDFDNINALICNRHETEIGHRYGIQFQLTEDESTQKKGLQQLEDILSKNQDEDDRWNLFNEE